MKLGFVGLGNMGSGMASRLMRAGHDVTVYNRTVSKVEPLQKQGAGVAKSPADAARGAEAVITMLSDDAALEAVTLGAGEVERAEALVGGLGPHAIHISASTIAPSTALRLDEAHRR